MNKNTNTVNNINKVKLFTTVAIYSRGRNIKKNSIIIYMQQTYI